MEVGDKVYINPDYWGNHPYARPNWANDTFVITDVISKTHVTIRSILTPNLSGAIALKYLSTLWVDEVKTPKSTKELLEQWK